MTFIQTIIKEMAAGNFSFAILIIGIAQLIVMIISLRRGRKHKNEKT